MTVTIPVVVLLGVAVFLLWRMTPLGAVVITIVGLFGFFLAKSSAGDEIQRGVSGGVSVVEDVADGAK